MSDAYAQLMDSEQEMKRMCKFNTFFLDNQNYNVEVQTDIDELKTTMVDIYYDLMSKTNNVIEQILIKYFQKPNGLECVLILTGISQETFDRILLFLDSKNDTILNSLINKQNWIKKDVNNYKKLKKHIQTDPKMAEGIAKLFSGGFTNKDLTQTMSIFELQKFDKCDALFTMDNILDSLIRYNIRGRKNATKESNADVMIIKILKKLNLSFDREILVKNISRRMDFAIPNKTNPKILIEVSYHTTTSSTMTDKAKREINVRDEIKQYYPNCKFVGFVDGAGWLKRPRDLERMINACDKTFTFHLRELESFEQFVRESI